MSEFDNATTSADAAPQDQRTMALLSHVLGIFTWFIGPLIIWLVSKDAQPAKAFVTDQAKESLNFQITVTLGYVVAIILMTVTLGLLFFLPMLVGLVNLVFCILAAVKANSGESYRYPFALRLIK